MKHTTFQFGLRTDLDRATLDAAINAELPSLDGVQGLSIECDVWGTTLNIQVEFADEKSAMKLHRKIVKSLKRMEGVLIAHARSNLTDIFS